MGLSSYELEMHARVAMLSEFLRTEIERAVSENTIWDAERIPQIVADCLADQLRIFVRDDQFRITTRRYGNVLQAQVNVLIPPINDIDVGFS